MFNQVCHGKFAGCEIYLLIQNAINLIFALILLIFSLRFVNNPCLCYHSLCYIPNWDYVYDDINGDNEDIHYQYYCTSRTWKKLPTLKILLASAVLMLICSVFFIIIYLIVWVRLHVNARSNNQRGRVADHNPSTSIHLQEQPPQYLPIFIVYRQQNQQSY